MISKLQIFGAIIIWFFLAECTQIAFGREETWVENWPLEKISYEIRGQEKSASQWLWRKRKEEFSYYKVCVCVCGRIIDPCCKNICHVQVKDGCWLVFWCKEDMIIKRPAFTLIKYALESAAKSHSLNVFLVKTNYYCLKRGLLFNFQTKDEVIELLHQWKREKWKNGVFLKTF